MICLNCGGEIKIETEYEFKEVKVGHCYKCEVVIGAGLEKIEPLGRYYSHDDIINKLNETIEKVNLLIDLQNRGKK